jgi:hypothetical protein
MKTVLLSIGHDYYVIPAKAGMAGKLIELLSEIVPVSRNYERLSTEDCYRIIPKSANVAVQIIDSKRILPPKKEDMQGDDVVELKLLPGAIRLLKGGAA